MGRAEIKSKKHYNKKAFYYNETIGGKFTMSFKKFLLSKMDIKSNSKVLDIACGNGDFLEMVNKKESVIGFGIDISENMILSANSKNLNMIFKTSSCEDIPFETSSFDIITVCASFHHFSNIDGFIKEANRLLKKQGELYIAEINCPFILRIILNIFLPLSKAGDVKIYSSKELTNFFEIYGFKKVEISKKGYIQIVKFQKLYNC